MAQAQDFYSRLMNHPAMQMGMAFAASEGDPGEAMRINNQLQQQRLKQEAMDKQQAEEEEFRNYILENEEQLDAEFGPGSAKMLYYRPQLAQTIIPGRLRAQRPRKESRRWAQTSDGRAVLASDDEIRDQGLGPYEKPKGQGSSAKTLTDKRNQYIAQAEAGAGEKALKAINEMQPVLRKQNTDIRQVMQLADEYGQTGAFGEELLKSRKVLDRLGFDVGDVDAGEMVQALGTKMQFAATEQLKGHITDREQMMARGTIPNISMTPAGIKRLGKYILSLNQREYLFNRFQKAYFGKVGSFDGAEGAFRAMQNKFGSGVSFDDSGNFRINKKAMDDLGKRKNWAEFLTRDYADYDDYAEPQEQIPDEGGSEPMGAIPGMSDAPKRRVYNPQTGRLE